jgi:hypothetical protein
VRTFRLVASLTKMQDGLETPGLQLVSNVRVALWGTVPYGVIGYCSKIAGIHRTRFVTKRDYH